MATTRRASEKDPALDPSTDQPVEEKTAEAPKSNPLDALRDSDPVRVRHPETGDHYTTTAVLARIQGATLLPDHKAVDQYGRYLPRKRNTSKES